MCVPAWASFFNWGLAEPARPDQRFFDQLLRGFRIKGLLKGIPAHIFDRNLFFPLSAKPPQDFARLGVAVGQTDLPKGGSGMWPEIVDHQPHGGGNELGLDRGWWGRRRAD